MVDITGEDVALGLSVGGGQQVVGLTSDAIAFRITDAGIVFVIVGASPTGTLHPLLTLDGAITVEVNSTQATQRLEVGGVTYTLAPAAPNASYVRIELVDAQIGINTSTGSGATGLSFTADRLVFERLGSVVTVVGSDVSLSLVIGGQTIIALLHADLGVRFAPGGVTAALVGGQLDGSGLGFSALGGSFTTEVTALLNTVGSAVTVKAGADDVVVPAAGPGAPFARVELVGAQLTLEGVQLGADRFTFETNVDGVAIHGHEPPRRRSPRVASEWSRSAVPTWMCSSRTRASSGR